MALPVNQAACQKGRGTTEQIQTLKQTIEKHNEFNGSGVIFFIGFKEETVINPSYINHLARLYDNSNSRIRSDLGINPSIRILRWLKQGDI